MKLRTSRPDEQVQQYKTFGAEEQILGIVSHFCLKRNEKKEKKCIHNVLQLMNKSQSTAIIHDSPSSFDFISAFFQFIVALFLLQQRLGELRLKLQASIFSSFISLLESYKRALECLRIVHPFSSSVLLSVQLVTMMEYQFTRFTVGELF